MSIYLDSSALLAALLDEPSGERTREAMTADPMWFTARHTAVEVRRNLARLLSANDLDAARSAFETDWARTNIIELDEITCEHAARIAEETGVRSLDALHLAAARRIGGDEIAILTFDRRQRDAAQAIGLALMSAGN